MDHIILVVTYLFFLVDFVVRSFFLVFNFLSGILPGKTFSGLNFGEFGGRYWGLSPTTIGMGVLGISFFSILESGSYFPRIWLFSGSTADVIGQSDDFWMICRHLTWGFGIAICIISLYVRVGEWLVLMHSFHHLTGIFHSAGWGSKHPGRFVFAVSGRTAAHCHADCGEAPGR